MTKDLLLREDFYYTQYGIQKHQDVSKAGNKWMILAVRIKAILQDLTADGKFYSW